MDVDIDMNLDLAPFFTMLLDLNSVSFVLAFVFLSISCYENHYLLAFFHHVP